MSTKKPDEMQWRMVNPIEEIVCRGGENADKRWWTRLDTIFLTVSATIFLTVMIACAIVVSSVDDARTFSQQDVYQVRGHQ